MQKGDAKISQDYKQGRQLVHRPAVFVYEDLFEKNPFWIKAVLKTPKNCPKVRFEQVFVAP